MISLRVRAARLNRQQTSVLSVQEAKAITGGLSSPSKMPCHTFNLPASACKIGSRLRNVKGSTCARCYAADTPQHVLIRSKELRRGAPTNYV